MPIPRSVRRWIPRRARLTELIFTAVILGGAGLYVRIHDSKVLDDQIKLQEQMRDLINTKSQAGVVSALLPYLVCSNNDELRTLAIDIALHGAAEEMTMLADDMKKCKNSNVTPKEIEQRAISINNAHKFLDYIKIGQQYDDDGQWKAAAQKWHEAAKIASPSLKEKQGRVLEDADRAYQQNRFEAAADLYKLAYSDVFR